ncbi:MAG: alpha-E domain-containing protein [Pyrinomonadaceae bacterium]
MLLDIYLTPLLEIHQRVADPLDYLELVAVLKSCTAFESYCQVYTAYLQPHTIAEFLLLNAECPRSVRFAVDSVQNALQTISKISGDGKTGRAEHWPDGSRDARIRPS